LWVLLILLWGTAFWVSCCLAIVTADAQKDDPSGSVIGILLGGSRLALNGYFYELADTYFHGGWERTQKQAFSGGFVQKLRDIISPKFHMHIGGTDIREIMPWFRLATLMNPADVRTYLDTAFWLAHDANRPDLAEQVLNEAQANNPFNYAIQLEKGRILLKEKKIDDGRMALDAGLAFWPGKDDPQSFETLDGKARLLLYRALLYEADGQKEKAVACLKEIVSMFPERKALLDRIKDLEEGKEPSLLASKMWSDMLNKDADKRTLEHQEKH